MDKCDRHDASQEPSSLADLELDQGRASVVTAFSKCKFLQGLRVFREHQDAIGFPGVCEEVEDLTGKVNLVKDF